ncbi:cytochrome P450 [Phascolomyces articulosus]|uniref:Cytochrome P450 n=1 Tax=Phascolomyces articulosus TaxID=60185 RepID=A0AAD5JU91_9FUNG|nr:cytochrome P450 [Phascolomyces articulosus]
MSDFLLTTAKNYTGSVIALTSAAIFGILAIKYNDRALFSDRRDDIPTIKGVPLFGVMFDLVSNKLRNLEWFNENINKLDTMTMYGTALGIPPMIMTIDPKNIQHIANDNFSCYAKGDNIVDAGMELFGHGIFVANGEQWRYQRKAASLIFNTVNFRDSFTEVFLKEINTLSEHVFDKNAVTGEPINFQDAIYKFTLESFVNIGFGKKLNILTSKDKVPFAVSFDYCQDVMFNRLIDPFTNLRDKINSILHPSQLSHKDHVKVINELAYSLINERREQLKKGHEYHDLLSRFMSSRNEDGKTLNDKELRDLILNLIIAGRDTTAQTISWLLYYTLKYPSVEAKLLEEVKLYIKDEVENNPPKLYETIKKMIYFHAVLHETLRLDPIIGNNARTAVRDDVFPDGTRVRKGDLVLWNPYSMARSEKIWGPDANEFKPERWVLASGDLHREAPSKWPAFHLGPRVCLGQSLATLEVLVALGLLLKRYKFSLVPGQNITHTASLTHPIKDGLHVFVEKHHS